MTVTLLHKESDRPDAGADVRYVAEMLGHKKLETTMIYTRVSLEKLREVHSATHPAENPVRGNGT